jgi:hypothetical protein
VERGQAHVGGGMQLSESGVGKPCPRRSWSGGQGISGSTGYWASESLQAAGKGDEDRATSQRIKAGLRLALVLNEVWPGDRLGE